MMGAGFVPGLPHAPTGPARVRRLAECEARTRGRRVPPRLFMVGWGVGAASAAPGMPPYSPWRSPSQRTTERVSSRNSPSYVPLP